MMYLFLALLSSSLWAQPTARWLAATSVTERHEFYPNNEVIITPKNAWQLLFAVEYPDANLKLQKDCVFYHVPGDQPGILKIKFTSPEITCDKWMFEKGDEEWAGLRVLQFSVSPHAISINLTQAGYKSTKWDINFLNQKVPQTAKVLMSSAEYKAQKIIYLAPESKSSNVNEPKNLKKGEACHQIGDDCQELASSTCESCPEGWFEVPNGCPKGPKFCGIQECGRKNQPACRRGMKYQRVRKKYECRIDHSFAYCTPGLLVQCEGSLAYCR